MEKSYLTDEYLLVSKKAKTLLIKKNLYSKYKILFIFNNTIIYAIYIKNIL